MLGDGGVMFTIAELAAAAPRPGCRSPWSSSTTAATARSATRWSTATTGARRRPRHPRLPRAGSRSRLPRGGVGSTEEVGPAVAAALTADRPTLIHVREEEVEQ